MTFDIHFTVMGILGKDVVSRVNADGAHLPAITNRAAMEGPLDG